MTRAKDISKILTDADISGNIDVDGVTNLDVTDIDGTLNVAGETTLQTHLNMGDNDTIKLGDGVDLTLASNGTHGTIATPNGILTVDAASTLILDSDAGNIQLKDGGNNFMTLSQTSSTVASINIPTSDGDLHIVGNDGGVAVTAMSFDMSAGGAATIANGLTLTDGNLVVANGHGIDFGATANISGTSSELLDDYETGTGDSTITGTGGGTLTTANDKTYRYTKVGNLVHFQVEFSVSGVGGVSGAIQVALPFASVDYVAGSIRAYDVTYSGNSLFAEAVPSGSQVVVKSQQSGDVTLNVLSTGYYFITIQYLTA